MADSLRNQDLWREFRCHRCGRCCTELGLPFDPFQIPDIAKFLGISVDEVMRSHYAERTIDGKHWEFDEAKRKPCPFLVADGSLKLCRIYPVRPQGCRAFPFDTDFGTSGVECPAAAEARSRVTGSCPK